MPSIELLRSQVEVINNVEEKLPKKRRFSAGLDRLFRKRFPIGSSSLDITNEVPLQPIDDDESLTDSCGSYSDSDGEKMSWTGEEGYTNHQFIFDDPCYGHSVQPEVVMTFSCKRRFGYLRDASDVMYLGDGRSLVVDLTNNRVLHYNKRGKTSMSYSAGHMIEPWAVAVGKNDVIHVTSRKTRCVARFSESGEIMDPITNQNFMAPSGVAIGKNGYVFVSDIKSNLLTAHDTDGSLLAYIGGNNSDTNRYLERPRYVITDPKNNIIVSDSGNHSLKVFDSEGNFVQQIGERGKAKGQLKFPYGVCTDQSGNIIVADHYNDRVSLFSKSGQFIRHLVMSLDGLNHPQGVDLTPNHRLLVTHGGLKAHEVLVYDLRNDKIDTMSSDREIFV